MNTEPTNDPPPRYELSESSNSGASIPTTTNQESVPTSRTSHESVPTSTSHTQAAQDGLDIVNDCPAILTLTAVACEMCVCGGLGVVKCCLDCCTKPVA
jgi:hypothetical protein